MATYETERPIWTGGRDLICTECGKHFEQHADETNACPKVSWMARQDRKAHHAALLREEVRLLAAIKEAEDLNLGEMVILGWVDALAKLQLDKSIAGLETL